jgi:hypothetical protein
MCKAPRWMRTVSIFLAVGSLFAIAVGVAGAQRGPQGGGGGQGTGSETGPRDVMDMRVARLAANLGVSEDALRAAIAQTHEDMRPMMEERMGQMREHMQQMHPGMPGMHGMPAHPGDMGRMGPPRLAPGEGHGANNRPMAPFGGPLFGQMPGDGAGTAGGPGQMMSTVAGILRMQPDELREQLASGRTLAEIARARGVDPDALADQLTSAFIQEHQGHLRAMIRESMDHTFGRHRAAEGE